MAGDSMTSSSRSESSVTWARLRSAMAVGLDAAGMGVEWRPGACQDAAYQNGREHWQTTAGESAGREIHGRIGVLLRAIPPSRRATTVGPLPRSGRPR